jgi:thiol-disulfide isomerase/thioredoxin
MATQYSKFIGRQIQDNVNNIGICVLLFLFQGTLTYSSSQPRIGRQVPTIKLIDTSGKMVRLSDFKGKVLYIDFWTPSCAPCLKMAPFETSLANRISEMSLDTAISIIKICDACEFHEWKNVVRNAKGAVINLFFTGGRYTLNRKFDSSPYPTYHIVSREFKYLGIEVALPNNENIDYCLFRALDNIPFNDSINEARRFNEKISKGERDIPDWYLAWRNKFLASATK